MQDEAQGDEILLDPEVAGIAVALVPVALPAPAPPLPRPDGFADDDFAARTPEGRIVAFLREPVGRCHYDRVLVADGARRFERPLPAWVYYQQFLALGDKLLLGGCEAAWTIDWATGEVATILSDPGSDGVAVAWADGVAVAAGRSQIAIDRPGARVALPCRQAVAVRGLGGGLVVVGDDDGMQVILDGRVVARDWRSLARDFRAIAAGGDAGGDVLVTAGGEAFRVSVRRG